MFDIEYPLTDLHDLLARLPSLIRRVKGRDAYRIRIGDYRAIYEIHDRVLQVIIIMIGLLT